jgi:threonine/homoserine/homoserine lactone efflux protein
VVKWIGVGYLVFLGVALLRSKGSLDASLRVAETGQGSARALFLKCFLVAVTNPKGYLFVSAFLPQFIDPAAPQPGQYLALAVVFAAVDLAVMAGYAALGSRAARVLRRRGAIWLDRVCGGVFLALAGSLAFYRRAT